MRLLLFRSLLTLFMVVVLFPPAVEGFGEDSASILIFSHCAVIFISILVLTFVYKQKTKPPPKKAADDGPYQPLSPSSLRCLLSSDDFSSRFVLVDCRDLYSYYEDRIPGAVLFTDPDKCTNFLFKKANEGKIPIFYCENRLKKSPGMAVCIRGADWKHNFGKYPHVSFPIIYVLEKGYGGFGRIEFEGGDEAIISEASISESSATSHSEPSDIESLTDEAPPSSASVRSESTVSVVEEEIEQVEAESEVEEEEEETVVELPQLDPAMAIPLRLIMQNADAVTFVNMSKSCRHLYNVSRSISPKCEISMTVLYHDEFDETYINVFYSFDNDDEEKRRLGMKQLNSLVNSNFNVVMTDLRIDSTKPAFWNKPRHFNHVLEMLEFLKVTRILRVDFDQYHGCVIPRGRIPMAFFEKYRPKSYEGPFIYNGTLLTPCFQAMGYITAKVESDTPDRREVEQFLLHARNPTVQSSEYPCPLNIVKKILKLWAQGTRTIKQLHISVDFTLDELKTMAEGLLNSRHNFISFSPYGYATYGERYLIERGDGEKLQISWVTSLRLPHICISRPRDDGW